MLSLCSDLSHTRNVMWVFINVLGVSQSFSGHHIRVLGVVKTAGDQGVFYTCKPSACWDTLEACVTHEKNVHIHSNCVCLSHVPALLSPCRTVQPCSSISQAHATGSAWAPRAKATTASLWATLLNPGQSTVMRSSPWQQGWRRGLRKAKMNCEQYRRL